jgi:hypothetical protein
MKNINEFTNDEFLKLHKRFHRQRTYLEKVRLIYKELNAIKGEETREIEGEIYTISLQPENKEQDAERWKFLADEKYKEHIAAMRTDIFGRLDKVSNKIYFIEEELKRLDADLKGDALTKIGFDMKARGIGWEVVNFHPYHKTTFKDMSEIGRGIAIHEMIEELKSKKKEIESEGQVSDIGMDGDLIPQHLVGLIQELGLVEHIEKKYPSIANKKVNIIGLLSWLCQVDKGPKGSETKEFRTFDAAMKKMMNGQGSSAKAKERLQEIFIQCRIDIPATIKNTKKDSKKTRR